MIKARINGVVTPMYSDGDSVMVKDPNNPSGPAMTLNDRLNMGGGGDVQIPMITLSEYNQKAKNGQLDPNKVYFVTEQ